ncbi:MAG: hypothetical protein V4695_12650 [Pseudomonadota bacterium]
MSMQDRKIRITQRLIAGMALALAVSFATAAMLVLLPGKTVPSSYVAPQTVEHAMSEYVQLHQARHTVVPNYMHIDVATSTE